ncbi:MAG: hypothetical protein R2864_15525 [Syntrophotaleaceae bacterium]
MGLGGLLGCELNLPVPTTDLVSKKEFFSQTRKKLVMVKMNVSGDRQGAIYVFCRVKDAVHLGGVLIMLPPAELEDRIKKETYGEEEADAFGEIANILSGELCSAFEELYPDKLHFKIAGLEAIVPSKIKADAPEPFPPDTYLRVAYSPALDGQALDELILLFPAALLGIEVDEPEAPMAPATTTASAASSTTGRLVDPEEAAALLGDGPLGQDGSTGVAVDTVPEREGATGRELAR